MMKVEDLCLELASAGVAERQLIRLDGAATVAHMRYLDLLASEDDLTPDAVVEARGEPVLYVIRADRLGKSTQTVPIDRLIRTLACHADAHFLAVVRPGTIDVYPISLVGKSAPKLELGFKSSDKIAAILNGSAFGSPQARKLWSAHAHWLESLLFTLLSQAASSIREACPELTPVQVMGLVGRGLFFRFLMDRQIVTSLDLAWLFKGEQVEPEEVFADTARLDKTVRWIDATFNGDLFAGHSQSEHLAALDEPAREVICRELTRIQYRAPNGQLSLGWSGIRFQHVPVDVLSQVYESFAHQLLPAEARQKSVHFTPRRLAEMVLDGAFDALDDKPTSRERVLDPAVGGGVFLVLALKKLVALRWQQDDKRPQRAQIREILTGQLTGFDIDRDALHVAALSLNLAALELDPDPRPLRELRFDKLVGKVLIAVGSDKLDDLGSLERAVRDEYRGRFDIVVGNPPWTAFKGDRGDALNAAVTELLYDRGLGQAAVHRVRYGMPDPAFLLASAGWARPGGGLGIVMHARFLFQSQSFALRAAVFDRLRVTGVMNFSALRQDKRLWSSNDAPFTLVVARNAPPKDHDSFHFISPKFESTLSTVGQFRIDPTSVVPIAVRSVREDRYVFKAAFKGGRLGSDLLARLYLPEDVTIEIDGKVHTSTRQHAVLLSTLLEQCGAELKSGFQIGKVLARKDDTSHLRGKPLAHPKMTFTVDRRDSPRFDEPVVQYARSSEIFKGPLLLFREAPHLDRVDRGALFCAEDTVFSESFFGLSLHGKPEAWLLLDYLYVLSYSDVMLFHHLLTSSKFGVERDAIQQIDVASFPLCPPELLSPPQVREMLLLARALKEGKPDFERIDAFVSDLYELSKWDRQFVRDTVANECPFTKREALRSDVPPSAFERSQFLSTLRKLLKPFSADATTLVVEDESIDAAAGWRYVRIRRELGPSHSFELPRHMGLADETWASRVIFHLAEQDQVIALLDQRRYWTMTHARLLAMDWLRQTQSVP